MAITERVACPDPEEQGRPIEEAKIFERLDESVGWFSLWALWTVPFLVFFFFFFSSFFCAILLPFGGSNIRSFQFDIVNMVDLLISTVLKKN